VNYESKLNPSSEFQYIPFSHCNYYLSPVMCAQTQASSRVVVISIRIPNNPLQSELELIQTQMAQKPMLRAEVGMRVRCANKASAE
jgi:hypothetical protein